MKQLDPKSVWLFFIGSFFRFIFLGFFVGIYMVVSFSGEDGTLLSSIITEFLLPIIIGALIVGFIWAKLTYKFYRYELREDGFRKEHGIIWKKYVTIPYDRIQNVDIYRGLLARILGLSDLQIQTAGGITAGSYGAFSEGRLPGLSQEIAEQIRDEVIRRARQSKDQGL